MRRRKKEQQREASDWADFVEEVVRNHRPHAGHFSWETDRAIGGLGVVQEFAHSLAQQPVAEMAFGPMLAVPGSLRWIAVRSGEIRLAGRVGPKIDDTRRTRPQAEKHGQIYSGCGLPDSDH